MARLLKTVGGDFYITWRAATKVGAWPEVIDDFKIRVKYVANRFQLLIQISVAWVNETAGTN